MKKIKHKKLKNQKMSRWGIGPLFALLSFAYSLIILLISFFYFPVRFVLFIPLINIILGALLVLAGLPLFIFGAYTLHKNFNSGQLQTHSVYSLMRHPIYGSWIIFIVPGLVLLFPYLLGISVPFFMYFLFKHFIPKEENYLRNKFGQKYLSYQKKVNPLFPTLFKHWGFHPSVTGGILVCSRTTGIHGMAGETSSRMPPVSKKTKSFGAGDRKSPCSDRWFLTK